MVSTLDISPARGKVAGAIDEEMGLCQASRAGPERTPSAFPSTVRSTVYVGETKLHRCTNCAASTFKAGDRFQGRALRGSAVRDPM